MRGGCGGPAVRGEWTWMTQAADCPPARSSSWPCRRHRRGPEAAASGTRAAAGLPTAGQGPGSSAAAAGGPGQVAGRGGRRQWQRRLSDWQQGVLIQWTLVSSALIAGFKQQVLCGREEKRCPCCLLRIEQWQPAHSCCGRLAPPHKQPGAHSSRRSSLAMLALRVAGPVSGGRSYARRTVRMLAKRIQVDVWSDVSCPWCWVVSRSRDLHRSHRLNHRHAAAAPRPPAVTFAVPHCIA